MIPPRLFWTGQCWMRSRTCACQHRGTNGDQCRRHWFNLEEISTDYGLFLMIIKGIEQSANFLLISPPGLSIFSKREREREKQKLIHAEIRCLMMINCVLLIARPSLDLSRTVFKSKQSVVCRRKPHDRLFSLFLMFFFRRWSSKKDVLCASWQEGKRERERRKKIKRICVDEDDEQSEKRNEQNNR